MTDVATDPLAQIGKRAADRRAKKSWTQQELLQRMNATRYRPNVKQTHISNIENGNGEKLPSLRSAAAMAEVLDTSIDYLAGLSDNESPAKAEPYRVAVNAADEEERLLLQELFDLIHERTREDQQFIAGMIRRLAAAPAPSASKPPVVVGEPDRR